MAIHDLIEVRIFVKGMPAQEYDDSENCGSVTAQGQHAVQESGPVIGKCIESVPGENFAIEAKINNGFELKPYQALEFAVYVDGRWVDGLLALKSRYNSGSGWVGMLDGASFRTHGIWQKRKFKFQMLRTNTEQSNEKLDVAAAAKSGSIQVVVKRVKVINKAAPELERADRSVSNTKVPEKHLKDRATDSLTDFNMPEATGNGNIWEAEPVDNVPRVNFDFRHYTRNGLKNLGIINEPDPPDPSDLLYPEKLSLEESLQLLDIAQAGIQKSRRIKDENQQNSSTSSLNKRARVEFESDGLEEIAAPAPAARQRETESVDLE